ncbi:unnamed protein product [Miscanthus lutarioriparius]|uniref:Uncharacterized protein n=1 Tax=Miscanthus lutarioriparius TaxID=422564 RepID=A0A811RBI4_9POAL|nr:unnamed protein product [Miscanthus lutarioriparius]
MAGQQQPTAAAYSRKQITDSMAFTDEILAELDGGDADAVGSRAAELLRGHPDVLRRFTAHVHADAPAEEGLALTRPRRSSHSRRRSERDTHQTPAAAAAPPEAPPNVAAAARNHHGVDRGLRLADAARALTFVKRVHETLVHGRFLAVLSEAQGSEDMFADEIYDRAKRAFGPAHVGLLHAFATVWLPGEEEWKLQQARGPAPARQRSREVAASASHAGMPDANKKPRADDDGNNGRRHDPAAIAPRQQRNCAAGASSHAAAAGIPDAKKPRADDGNYGRQHDHVIAVLEVRNVKKRRSDDDGTGRGLHALHRIGESSGGGAAKRGRDYDYDYAPQSRAKKHHSGNGEFSGSAPAAQKPPRRRAASGGKSSSAGAAAVAKQQPEQDDEVRRFRQEWEFQTYYSELVATSDRVTELLCPSRTRTTPHGGGGGGGGNRSLEALFPLPECREFLHNYYGDRWGEMRAVLERGESRVPALEAIERRLRTKEEQAVAEESPWTTRWTRSTGSTTAAVHERHEESLLFVKSQA